MGIEAVWHEEIRSFPYGGRGAALWVVYRPGEDAVSPLQLLCSWSVGEGVPELVRQNIPLGAMLRTVQTGVGELVPIAASNQIRTRGAELVGRSVSERSRSQQPVAEQIAVDKHFRLWIEPLGDGGKPQGACALVFDDTAPWGNAVRLWMQRFTARLGPWLEHLASRSCTMIESLPGTYPAPAASTSPRPYLFSTEQLDLLCCRNENSVAQQGILLPRPVCIDGLPGAVGVSEEMVELGASIARIAASGVNVLLHGESGTGKEVIAQAIHQGSRRHQGTLVGINAAALPENLFESELFGHRAGAFTGASGDKKGLLEAADGGTFFLDEIGDMPLMLQIKLLRVIQERRVRRIGDLDSRSVDIRFIAATHKDLEQEITAGRFRLDLFYRLKVISIEIPPLYRRPEDVTHLLAYFLNKHAVSRQEWRISERALAALQSYRWPGNVRELENEASRLLALCPEQNLFRFENLSATIRQVGDWSLDPSDLTRLRRLDQASELLEQYLIRKAIASTGGRKAAAARRLGLSRQGLYKKIQRYGMTDLIGGSSGAGCARQAVR